MFEFNFSFVKKMTFVSKGMAQKSGKSHLCNVKCRKFCDGEQPVLVFVKVPWYANRCIVTDVRIHLFVCEKMTFVSKGMAQKSGKSHLCNVKCRKFCDGEQDVLVFLKVLWYASKCIVTNFGIHLFFCGKKTFVSKAIAQKSEKSHLCNVKCRKFRDGEQDALVFLKVLLYTNKCIVTDFRIHLFFCEKYDFCIKRDGSKSGKSHLCNVKCREFCDGEQDVWCF